MAGGQLVPGHIVPIVVFLAVVGFMFWWIVVRPTNQRIREHRELVESLRIGDRVITAGGIYGKIVGLDDETVRLEIADGVVITLRRFAVRQRAD